MLVFLARQGNVVTAIDYSEDGLEKTKNWQRSIT